MQRSMRAIRLVRQSLERILGPLLVPDLGLVATGEHAVLDEEAANVVAGA
jgi:hypothetical protein